jgi:hypothetical protein
MISEFELWLRSRTSKDLPACQRTKISQISITSNVLLAIAPPSLDGGMILTSR